MIGTARCACSKNRGQILTAISSTGAARNIRLYPWFKFFQNLIFWQAVWFLYFQDQLSAADAILLYVVFDVATTILEVPSGYMSDRLGRRVTLILSALAGLIAGLLLAFGDGFQMFAMAQVLLGASAAFASGTDNALLFESLAATGRQGEVERQELRAWRFTFCALAIAAVLGGVLTLFGGALPFLAGAAAFAVVLGITLAFREPAERERPAAVHNEARLDPLSLGDALTQPVLVWLFALSVLMYVFSHVPFVFGQPFIQQALAGSGFDGEVPLVSGSVSALMMILSVATSLIAIRLRHKLGLPAILMLAFAMQIAISGALALTGSALAIAVLLLRMVPNSLSQPFIMARIQPLLSNQSRATYLSVRSFCGRLIFAATLFLATGPASETSAMSHDEIRQILGWYCIVGLSALTLLALAARRLSIEQPDVN